LLAGILQVNQPGGHTVTRKLFSRLFTRNRAQAQARSVGIEPLEDRKMMALMTVKSALFDNRGEGSISLSTAAQASTINNQSVRVYTAGNDNKLGTSDDVRVPATVVYVAALKRIVVTADIEANEGYKVRIYGNRVKAADGTFLDGEFKGKFPTGNGVAGGNFECKSVSNATGKNPTVRMSTNLGVIQIKLLQEHKPISAANYMFHMNNGDYDNMMMTRSVPGFVVQMGSLKINGSDELFEPASGPMIQNEFTKNGVISNTRGTIAYAKSGGNPNSATNQFFFNLGDNSGNLDNQNGGFTVFATVKDAASQAVVDAIAALQTVALFNDLQDPDGSEGVAGPFDRTGVSDVPVKSRAPYTGNGTEELISNGSGGVRIQFVVHGNFHAPSQTVVARRTALVNTIKKV
jgi:cyclophilin family peptidyl-prolyl cis-trans isomerase